MRCGWANALLTWLVVILLYNEVERKLAEDCVHRMVKRAVEMEGTVTVGRLSTPFSDRSLVLLTVFPFQGEHGVGLVKRDYLPHELGETTVDAMRKVGSPFFITYKIVKNPLTTPPMIRSKPPSTRYASLTATRSSVYRSPPVGRWLSGRRLPFVLFTSTAHSRCRNVYPVTYACSVVVIPPPKARRHHHASSLPFHSRSNPCLDMPFAGRHVPTSSRHIGSSTCSISHVCTVYCVHTQ